MKIADVLSKNLKTISPEETIQQAARIMNRYRIGSLVVVSGIVLAGIITERDILKAFAKATPPSTKVRDVMTGYVITIAPDKSLEDASRLMVKNGVKRLPVVTDNGCIGIVSSTDLISCEKRLLKNLEPLFSRKRQMLLKAKA